MLDVIVFSKDRPFQLKEYLRTASEYLRGDKRITVLWTASAEFEGRYHKLIQMFPKVTFVNETHFEDQIFTLVGGCADHVMFGVDDAFFYEILDVTAVCQFLDRYQQCFGFHAKLSPGLSVCNSAGGITQRRPPIGRAGDFCIFDWRLGTFDWSYPWEVIGTVYRKRDVVKLVEYASRKTHLDTPNHFEGVIASLFRNHDPIVDQMPPIMACCDHPVLSVVTVNCVQTDRTPVFPSPYSTTDELNVLFDEGDELDEVYYRMTTFNSVHVGDFVLK